MTWSFDSQVYAQYRNSYWPMPNSLVTDDHLARLWRGGDRSDRRCSGTGIAILPMIGVYANTVRDGLLYLGQERMAEIAGLCVSSVRTGGEILERCGLGKRGMRIQPNGLPVSTWTLGPEAVVAKLLSADPQTPSASSAAVNYFSFPARALFGGNWRALTPVQQAIYLAVGAHVRTHSCPESTKGLLDWVLPTWDADTILSRPGRLMLTTDLSLAALGKATGIGRSALSAAIGTLPADRTALFGAFRMKGSGKNLFVAFDDFDHCGREAIDDRWDFDAEDLPPAWEWAND